jgi:hypothetical protein
MARQLSLRSLEVRRLLDIEEIRLDFDPRLTVLTGRNSQGKTLLCGAAILALLGLKELGSTHWKEKISSKNLARRGWQKGSASLQVLLNKEPYIFTYHDRRQSPHVVEGPDGRVDGKDALVQCGVDLGAIGFLTTRERQPPWRIVDGDSKGGDTNTILRNSLSVRLSARVSGCEGVRKVVDGEIKNVRQQFQKVEGEVGDILNGWINKGGLSAAEAQENISADVVSKRQATLTSLKELLEGVENTEKRLEQLNQLRQQFDEVKDLAALAGRRACLDALLGEIQNQEKAIESLDMELLKDSFSCPSGAVLEVENQITACNISSKRLRDCLMELTEQQARPASLAELTANKSTFDDQKKKLERAKALQGKRGRGAPVSCTVYRGEKGDNLLLELDKDFAATVSFDELSRAEVLVPYSKAEEEQVCEIAASLGQTEAAAEALQAALEATKGVLQTQISDLRVSITERRTKVKGMLPKLQEVHCPAPSMPNSETGERLIAAMEWLEAEIAAANNHKASMTDDINLLVAADGMQSWKEKTGCGGGASPGVPQLGIVDSLKEAIQSLAEHKTRFTNLLEECERLRRLQRKYDRAFAVLGLYLDRIRFKDEILDQLIQTFLEFVRRGKEYFDFPFEIDEQSDGQLAIQSPFHEGLIQTGGGETQVLGILEMLAIAEEFGLPVFLDEIGSYLDRDNLRKIFEFLLEHTEVQAVLTTADDALLEYLQEWGIPHRSYMVMKDSQGFTQVQSAKSRAS